MGDPEFPEKLAALTCCKRKWIVQTHLIMLESQDGGGGEDRHGRCTINILQHGMPLSFAYLCEVYWPSLVGTVRQRLQLGAFVWSPPVAE